MWDGDETPREVILPSLPDSGLLVRSIVVTNSADAAVGDNGDNVHLQGQAAVRNQVRREGLGGSEESGGTGVGRDKVCWSPTSLHKAGPGW